VIAPIAEKLSAVFPTDFELEDKACFDGMTGRCSIESREKIDPLPGDGGDR